MRLQEGQFAQQLGKAAAAAQYTSDVHRLLITSVIALAIVAVLALGLGWFVAGRILRPVRAITATARRISASNLHQRLALDGADEEFKNLGDTLDELFARLDAAFDAQQHFVANASHELRTPLTAERALLQVALDDPYTTSEDWRSTAKEVLTANSAQERLIEALLALASSEAGLGHRERIDLPAICRSVLARPGPGTGAPGLQIETALCSATLDGDPRLIERLVANLADNATGHNVTGGHVWVATAVTDGTAVLSVANTGPLIPASDVNRLFQPFQRLEGGLSIEVTFPPPANCDHLVRSQTQTHHKLLPPPPANVTGSAAAMASPERRRGQRRSACSAVTTCDPDSEDRLTLGRRPA